MDAAEKEKLARQREHLRHTFLDQDPAKHGALWDNLWQDGTCTPWDRGYPNPALEDTLADRKDVLGTAAPGDQSGSTARKRALVPGCGKGYDVLLLASFGYDAYGLDVSETVIRKCEDTAKQDADKYPARDQAMGKGNFKFVCGDYFSNDWGQLIDGGIGEGFDLIYDYTVSGFLTLDNTFYLMHFSFYARFLSRCGVSGLDGSGSCFRRRMAG